ncbi:MAG TPA: hypothetical protein PK900_13500, partial [Spirochaetota bacterium]|nr:hypothetical protein [Spirochaetota bacterium]
HMRRIYSSGSATVCVPYVSISVRQLSRVCSSICVKFFFDTYASNFKKATGMLFLKIALTKGLGIQ